MDLEIPSSANQALWYCVWLNLLLSLHYMARVWYVERHVPELSSPKVKQKCMWPGLCPKLVRENLFGFSMLHSFSPTLVITGLKGKQDQIYQVIVAWWLYLKNKTSKSGILSKIGEAEDWLRFRIKMGKTGHGKHDIFVFSQCLAYFLTK